MSKTWIVIKKEYLSKVKKKSFIIMTLLVPILLLLMMFLPLMMTMFKSGTTRIAVLDESALFNDVFSNSKTLLFIPVQGNLNNLKENMKDKYDALLYIPKFDLKYPGGFKVYSEEQTGMMYLSIIKDKISAKIENLRFQNAGLDKEMIEAMKVNINIENILLVENGEKKSNAIISIALSQIMGFIQYFMIFFYGSMIMRSISEEKKNRIVEIIVSSVKPFQLMAGKIIGIASVALTQLAIWAVLISILAIIFSVFMMPYMAEQQTMIEGASNAKVQTIIEALNGIGSMNLPLLLFSFAFYFVFGYLFYSALFGAAGSIVDDETQNQTITLPISIPIIISMFIMINVAEQPNSPLALWSSLIPFCSPIVMIARLPFGVPIWQLISSMILLILGFVLNIWVAGKIYRIGILLYGKKVNWNDIRKWLFVK